MSDKKEEGGAFSYHSSLITHHSSLVMVPFVDLQAQYRAIKAEIDEAVARVLDTSAFILGREVEAFERAFADYLGARFCVGVSNGTAARSCRTTRRGPAACACCATTARSASTGTKSSATTSAWRASRARCSA